MASPQEQVAEKARRKRERKTRPDGSFYSSDPKERYQQLIEDGKIGAPGSEMAREHGARGGRPRKVPVSEYVAEMAREDAVLIYEGLKAGLYSSDKKQRRESALAIIGVEDTVMKRHEREVKAGQVDKDQLIDKLVDLLTGDTPAARAIRSRMSGDDVVDATVVEDEQRALVPA